MELIFLSVLNMSLTGGFIIGMICLLRIPLKKAPTIISYCLWAVAGFRLVFPFSLKSVLSLMPFNTQIIPANIGFQATPRINSGIAVLNNAVSDVLPVGIEQNSINPLQVWIFAGTAVWVIGMAAMSIYGLVSFIILKGKMKQVDCIKDNIYEAENIKTPFVLGILKPRIYLPLGLSKKEQSYIIMHEHTHISRYDHIIKFMAYFILCIHWFNPMAWVAFKLMGDDMELSCDEHVLKEMGMEMKKDYSLTLLSLASEQPFVNGTPLAFGEGSIKKRIKNILNFKKQPLIIILAGVLLAAVFAIGLALDKPTNKHSQLSVKTYYLENMTERQRLEQMKQITLYSDGTALLDTPLISSYYLPSCTYTFIDDELLVYADIETKTLESAFGVKDRDIIARFSVTDEGDLIYTSASVPIFAVEGARYVLKKTTDEENYEFESYEWMDFYYKEPIPWTSTYDLMLDEFPGVMFSWTAETVTASSSEQGSQKELFSGMPIWNVFISDLNSDGFPELCATVSIGSGMIDTRIIICDYANDKLYGLSDRGTFDYALSLENGDLIVTQTKYASDTVLSVGIPRITDGELVVK